MPCVKRPLILLAFISILWVPRLHAESHFTSCTDGTGNIFNATVIVTENSLSGWTGGSLAPGSEIAVYSSDPNRPDRCVGMITWTGSAAALSIWGNDEYSHIIDGLNPDEQFHFRIFDGETNVEFSSDFLSTTYTQGDGIYNTDGVYIIESFTPVEQITAFTMSLRKGWNLVGIDRDVDDADYHTLFPTSVEQTLFRFDGNYVQQSDAVLSAGVGYWLRLDSATEVVIEGIARKSVTLELRTGWNLISGPGCSVSLQDTPDPDNVLIKNSLFQFDGSYSAASELSPGRSYWIRARESGSIDISCPQIATRISSLPNESTFSVVSLGKISSTAMTASNVTAANPLASNTLSSNHAGSVHSVHSGFGSQAAVSASLLVQDNANATTLKLGIHPDATDNFEIEHDLLAPPIPPTGAFDARSRIGAEDFLVDVRSSATDEQIYTLLYQPELDKGSIVVRWDPALLNELGEYKIVDNITGNLFGPLDMSTVDSLNIASSGGFLDKGLRIIYKPFSLFVPSTPDLVEPPVFAVDVPTVTTFTWSDAPADRYHIQISTMTDVAFDSPVFDDSLLTSSNVEFGDLRVSTQYIWRIRAKNGAGFSEWSSISQFTTSSIHSTPVDSEIDLPESVSLAQNYPNPFNPATTISFELDSAQQVNLAIFDMTGRKVQQLVLESRGPGRHEVRWDAARYSSGAYLYRLQVGSQIRTKTMILMK